MGRKLWTLGATAISDVAGAVSGASNSFCITLLLPSSRFKPERWRVFLQGFPEAHRPAAVADGRKLSEPS
jgi:hypothetical protein